MLLPDEQYVLKWLSQYGALTHTQVVRLLRHKPPDIIDKMLRGMKRQCLIADISGGYYLGLDPQHQPDQRVIMAVWVLLKFIDKVEPMAHYPAAYPSQLFFLKEDTGYEIVVLYEGEQHVLRLLQPQEDMKYIIVAPHGAMAQQLKLPRAPCLFATVDYRGQDVPEVIFFTHQEVSHAVL
jgi:hypothetical protein